MGARRPCRRLGLRPPVPATHLPPNLWSLPPPLPLHMRRRRPTPASCPTPAPARLLRSQAHAQEAERGCGQGQPHPLYGHPGPPAARPQGGTIPLLTPSPVCCCRALVRLTVAVGFSSGQDAGLACCSAPRGCRQPWGAGTFVRCSEGCNALAGLARLPRQSLCLHPPPPNARLSPTDQVWDQVGPLSRHPNLERLPGLALHTRRALAASCHSSGCSRRGGSQGPRPSRRPHLLS